MRNDITATEQIVLDLLIQAGKTGVSSNAIWNKLYGARSACDFPETRIIPVLICHLRKKVPGKKISNMRNFGYRLLEADDGEEV